MTQIDMAIDMLGAHQARAARLAVGPSTARNQGGAGVIAAAREYLTDLDLRRFSVADPGTFRHVLDSATEELRAAVPQNGRSWGLARKLLNIFIRDASYHVLLNRTFLLEPNQPWMEMPLDSLTAQGLKRVLPRGALPVWPGVKHLDPDMSDRYQAKAADVADAKCVLRIDLDVLWWGVRG